MTKKASNSTGVRKRTIQKILTKHRHHRFDTHDITNPVKEKRGANEKGKCRIWKEQAGGPRIRLPGTQTRIRPNPTISNKPPPGGTPRGVSRKHLSLSQSAFTAFICGQNSVCRKITKRTHFSYLAAPRESGAYERTAIPHSRKRTHFAPPKHQSFSLKSQWQPPTMRVR
jgi:hypothetical protein